MTDEPGFGKETHSTYEPLPEEIAARRVTDPPIQWESHEGMVTVYREDGTYAGCMGAERWERLLRADEVSRVTDSAAHTPDVSPDHEYRPVQTIEGIVCGYCKGPRRSPRHYRAHTPDVDTLASSVREEAAFLASWALDSAAMSTTDADAVGDRLLGALSDLAATARERDKAVRVAGEHAEAAMAAEQTNAELEAALARVANYLVACRDERHGTPGGDNCARCRSDNREIAALGLQKWWDGEKYVLRASGSCPGCGHDRHSPGYCVMLSGESATGTCQCQWRDTSHYDRDRLDRRVAELEQELAETKGEAEKALNNAAIFIADWRNGVAELEAALARAEADRG